MSIQSLKTISFQVLYDEIIKNFEKSGVDYVGTIRKSLAAIKFRLGKRLWYKYLTQLKANQHPAIDALLFLDGVLDGSFKVFDLNEIPLPMEATTRSGTFYLTKLNTMLGLHCPLLETLMTAFHHQWQFTEDIQRAFGTSFNKLSNLTWLDLKLTTTECCIQLYSCLGDSCPNVKKLVLDHLQANRGKEQQLALVLGDRASMIPIEFKQEMVAANSNLHLIGFESKFCTAICSSLESYTLINVNVDSRLAAFILRHFPLLQELCLPNLADRKSITIAIQDIHNLDLNVTPVTVSLPNLDFTWKTKLPFSGNLNLKRLTGVSGAGNVRSGHMLMAINSLCPALKQLELFSYEASKSRGFLRADKTERFFKNKFTEVDKIVANKIPQTYLRSVIEALKVNLKTMEFKGIKDLQIANLVPLANVDMLVIGLGCQMKVLPTEMEGTFDIAVLPCLKKLTTECCLPLAFSDLFECHRPLLTELHLNCCHIGVRRYGNDFTWDDVPNIWSNLQKLSLRCVDSSLTMRKLQQIVPMFEHLTELKIPSSIIRSQDDNRIADEMRNFFTLKFFPSEVNTLQHSCAATQ